MGETLAALANLRRVLSPAFRAGALLSLGAWVPKNLARRSLASAARCCSTCSGRLKRGASYGVSFATTRS